LRRRTAHFTNQLKKGEVLKIPIGHMEGNYFCEPDELKRLEREDRIAFRYATPKGEITAEANPNGSLATLPASERGTKCAGDDAASGSLERGAAGVGGRMENLCIDDGSAWRRVEGNRSQRRGN
jgi:hypothetical protein